MEMVPSSHLLMNCMKWLMVVQRRDGPEVPVRPQTVELKEHSSMLASKIYQMEKYSLVTNSIYLIAVASCVTYSEWEIRFSKIKRKKK